MLKQYLSLLLSKFYSKQESGEVAKQSYPSTAATTIQLTPSDGVTNKEMSYTPPLRGGLKISDMEDEYGIDKDIEIDFDMDVKEGIWKPAKNGRYRYRLSSYTCLAGDIIGDYQFSREINVGDRLVFEDMAIYSMVKNNTFNGIPLPDIVIMDSDGECKVWKHFGYEDFKGRL